MRRAISDAADREDAVIVVPENKKVTRDFGRETVLDLSSPEFEYEELMFPTEKLFDPLEWTLNYTRYWGSRASLHPAGDPTEFFSRFNDGVIKPFADYLLPVIHLEKETPKEAVCTVFEKVNTGGVPLNVFELATALPRIHRRTPMDGVRIAAGWVRELQGRWLGSIGVDWRSADGLQSPHRAPIALCGSCDARDGERIRSRELSRTGVARVCGEVGSVAGWQSGGEWNGSQSGHGATELGFPRPMLGKMQGKAARRSGDPSHQSEEPPPEGLGGRDPFTQADAGIQRARLCAITCTASQAPLAAKRPEGMWFTRRRT